MDSILVAIDIHLYDLSNLTYVSLNWDVKKSRRRMGGAERVGRQITSEVRWDQCHRIPLSSRQAPKSYFAGFRIHFIRHLKTPFFLGFHHF